jgi:hypothetical protein
MKHKKLKICVFVLLGLGFSPLPAQTTNTTTGGKATGIDGTVSYSVGQMVYTTNKASNGSVAQGVQQSYEISVVTGLKNTKSITLDYTAFPNPTSDFLKLKIIDHNIENLSCQLFDINGKQIISLIIDNSESTISLQGLLRGTYFLKLTDKDSVIKVFKIVKL